MPSEAPVSDESEPYQRTLADPLVEGLSDEQRQVVLAPAGPLLVLAGAGSGKTRALTQRVAYFLRQGLSPDRVLLVTFTNHAARQMLARLGALQRQPLADIWATAWPCARSASTASTSGCRRVWQ